MTRTPVPQHSHGFLRRHSLSIAALVLLCTWLLLYANANPKTHLGSFFGNAIADWTGVVVTVLATKYLYEIGSRPKKPGGAGAGNELRTFLRDHHLTLFLVLTGIGWVWLYATMDSEAKWGQVVGNIVSEWTQILGLVLMTRRFIEQKAGKGRP